MTLCQSNTTARADHSTGRWHGHVGSPPSPAAYAGHWAYHVDSQTGTLTTTGPIRLAGGERQASQARIGTSSQPCAALVVAERGPEATAHPLGRDLPPRHNGAAVGRNGCGDGFG